jgi:hypothetical protein
MRERHYILAGLDIKREERSMTKSKLIARLMGPVLLAMGIGIVLGMSMEGDGYAAMMKEFVASMPMIWLSGVLALVAGLAIVNAHSLWEPDWRVIITILGWLAIIRGLASMLFPAKVQTLGDHMITSPTGMIIGAAITVGLGAVLTFMGYEHLWAEKQRPARAAASSGSRRTAKRPRRRK